MKVLAVTSRFPYPIERGDKLRAFHQLRSLVPHHDVVLVALTERAVDPEHRAVVDETGVTTHVVSRSRLATIGSTGWGALRGVPVQVGYFMAPSTRRRVRELIESEAPDHLYCQLLRTAWALKGVDVAATIDYQDAFAAAMRRRGAQHREPLRRAFTFEAERIGRAEAAAFEHFGRRVVISDQDRLALEVPDPDGVQVLANGVDTTFFERCDPSRRTDFDVAFVGNMGYPPNVRAAHMLVDEIMPLVWEARPAARVLLAGARPARSVKALGSYRVTVSGWMDDIRDAYRRASVMVAPLFIGAGQQNKVLESMAMGVPCVTTDLVNNAIGATPGEHLAVADTAEGFATVVAGLLDSADRREAMAEAAAALVEDRFTWSAVGRRLSGIIEHGRVEQG